LGASRITDFDDDSKEARLCKEQYPKLRDELLRSHPWNFALARVTLAKEIDAPVFEYDAKFVLPLDVLRVMKTDFHIDPTTVETPWKIEYDVDLGRKVLLCDRDEVSIQYIRQVEDTQVFDSNFDEVLALRIAADLAYPLIQSTSLAQQMFVLYENQLALARSMDAQEGSLEQVMADDWLFSRY
jgi:hypothetical protein